MTTEASSSAVPIDVELQIDKLCEEFERAWRGGEAPRVEEYVARAPADHQAVAIRELVAQEVDLRRSLGELALVDEYRRRFPADQEPVQRAFELVGGTSRRGELTITRSLILDGCDRDGRDEALPVRIGRFAVEQVLGRGGYGTVYLAHDGVVDRRVALKVPHAHHFSSEEEIAAFLAEARTAAQLQHPGIVTIYDVCRDADRLFIVQEYVAGQNLGEYAKNAKLTTRQVAELIISVAEALGVAHRAGFVHRDLKPGNILMDTAGKPRIADFGLAIHESIQRRRRGETCGTAAYMSPEQVRGETHRLDGRSDIWSLGIVLYEFLVGRRPFTGDTREEVFDEIRFRDPRPPRQLRESVPVEVERICLKCLSKRISDRYSATADLVDDLRHWLKADSRPSVDSHAVTRTTVIPRGLHSFRRSDADFFVELLPGPRDRSGLPDCIRFWKESIEEVHADNTFRIGLIIGPSGCGKSSLVNAGLIPNLAPHVAPVYVESTASDTEVRLIKALAKHTQSASTDASLPEIIADLREGQWSSPGRKTLIVLDQFEQWLHSNRGESETQLHQALRQCDGGRVQCIILVRHDFWMATLQFLAGLEVDLVQGENFASVDLFDRRHAKKVLMEFGVGYGALPADPESLTSEQDGFLDEAIDELATDGQVACVRLALFAEMVKHKPWNLATLTDVGGAEGIGVRLLEEAFDTGEMNPKHMLHRKAAEAVLGALLPETGVDIRGHLRSQEELMQAAGYADRPRDFLSLLNSLDLELRLITPTHPEQTTLDDDEAPQLGRFYQLTHDFLVPAVREWLARKKRKTPRGRAQLLLADRLALWQTRRENKQLPTLLETVSIWRFTRSSSLKPQEVQMMRSAVRHHLRKLCVALLGISAVLALVLFVVLHVRQQREADYVAGLVAQIPRVQFEHLSTLVNELHASGNRWVDDVTGIAMDAERSVHDRVCAHVALARRDAQFLPFLRQRLLAADPDEHVVLREELRRWSDKLVPDLWATAADPAVTDPQRIRCAAALASYDGDNSQWDEISARVVRSLAATDPLLLAPWVESLDAVKTRLVPPLIDDLGSSDRTAGERLVAASILVNFGRADPSVVTNAQLAKLLLNASEDEVYARLLSLAAERGATDLFDRLTQELTTIVPINSEGEDLLLQRQANAAQAMLKSPDDRTNLFWHGFRWSNDPRLRTLLMDRFRAATALQEVLQKFGSETDPGIRQALVVALDAFRPDLSPADESIVVEKIREVFLHDPDPGMHSAAEWISTRWGKVEDVARWKQQLAGVPRGNRGWFINSELVTMLVIEPPGVVTMGSPISEPGRDRLETMQDERIDYSFAISAHEITVEQFLRFLPDFDYVASPHPTCPITKTSFYDAMKYCRWLSEQQPGFRSEVCCYPARKTIGAGMTLPDDFLLRSGYRLPTEVEWEHAVRAGTVTSRFFGSGTDHLPEYAWHGVNAGSSTRSVGHLRPNPFGLFDVYGNVSEWCHSHSNRAEDGTGILRGGHYRSTARFLRSAMPERQYVDAAISVVGFRVVTQMNTMHAVQDPPPEKEE